MTNQEIMVQILHEVTGKPKKELNRLVESIRAGLPNNGRGFDKERTDTEAKELLEQLRKEKAGILCWLVEGATLARLELSLQNTTRH